MKLEQYLDSTYLKTAEQAAISLDQTKHIVISLIEEAINNKFKLVMIRPEFVSLAYRLIQDSSSNVLIGTVIGFHEGTKSIDDKLNEAVEAIKNNVDELDFVVNYNAFINGQVNLVKSEIYRGTKLALENNKIIKWIIEIAALNTKEIIGLTEIIRDVVLENFGIEKAKYVFVKSSTGFFKTNKGKPNGATLKAMKLIIEYAKPLQIKAAGGVKNYHDAVEMLELGVTRIGTSSAKAIMEGENIKEY